LRHRIAVVLADGQWKTAQEVANCFLDEGWGFGSVRQIGSILSRTPGFSARHPGQMPNNQYRLSDPNQFHSWMDRKSNESEKITTRFESY
tara:strand:+ start:254 stop:523 length:270 start_codon:yes stop_codon:yes gene_type:complete